jgi:hypothetical protein
MLIAFLAPLLKGALRRRQTAQRGLLAQCVQIFNKGCDSTVEALNLRIGRLYQIVFVRRMRARSVAQAKMTRR